MDNSTKIKKNYKLMGTESDPLIIAQRLLNLYRQLHIFSAEKKEAYDKMLMEQPIEVKKTLGTLPGGIVVQEYLSDLEEKAGLESESLEGEKPKESEEKKEIPIQNVQVQPAVVSVANDPAMIQGIVDAFKEAIVTSEQHRKEDTKELAQTIISLQSKLMQEMISKMHVPTMEANASRVETKVTTVETKVTDMSASASPAFPVGQLEDIIAGISKAQSELIKELANTQTEQLSQLISKVLKEIQQMSTQTLIDAVQTVHRENMDFFKNQIFSSVSMVPMNANVTIKEDTVEDKPLKSDENEKSKMSYEEVLKKIRNEEENQDLKEDKQNLIEKEQPQKSDAYEEILNKIRHLEESFSFKTKESHQEQLTPQTTVDEENIEQETIAEEYSKKDEKNIDTKQSVENIKTDDANSESYSEETKSNTSDEEPAPKEKKVEEAPEIPQYNFITDEDLEREKNLSKKEVLSDETGSDIENSKEYNEETPEISSTLEESENIFQTKEIESIAEASSDEEYKWSYENEPEQEAASEVISEETSDEEYKWSYEDESEQEAVSEATSGEGSEEEYEWTYEEEPEQEAGSEATSGEGSDEEYEWTYEEEPEQEAVSENLDQGGLNLTKEENPLFAENSFILKTEEDQIDNIILDENYGESSNEKISSSS